MIDATETGDALRWFALEFTQGSCQWCTMTEAADQLDQMRALLADAVADADPLRCSSWVGPATALLAEIKTLSKCPECAGEGWVPKAIHRCCGGSQNSCMGRGCTGPVGEWIQEQCEYCLGSGRIAASNEHIPPMEEVPC